MDDGTYDQFSWPNLPRWSGLGGTQFSFEALLRKESDSQGYVLNIQDGAGGNSCIFWVTGDTARLNVQTDGTGRATASTTTLTNYRYFHVAATYSYEENKRLRLYLDGVLDDETTGTGSGTDKAWGGSLVLNGRIYDNARQLDHHFSFGRIYNKELTANEVRMLAGDPFGMARPGQLAMMFPVVSFVPRVIMN
jgi:hypothetical protein